MFIRITLLLGFFFLSIACGTGQGPRFLDITNNSILSNDEKERLIAEVKAKYETILGNKGFSGQILIAKNGEVIFEDYKGFSNFSDKTAILPETPIHLASISKTFTGMAALKLWEEDKLDLKAPVTKYISNFPYTSVTIEQLLSHRSGLPDYTYFMEPNKYKTVKVKNKRGRWVKKLKLIKAETPFRQGLYNNQDVLDYMVAKRPSPAAMPNRVFRYCNTNFVMLALIIEKLLDKTSLLIWLKLFLSL